MVKPLQASALMSARERIDEGMPDEVRHAAGYHRAIFRSAQHGTLLKLEMYARLEEERGRVPHTRPENEHAAAL